MVNFNIVVPFPLAEMPQRFDQNAQNVSWEPDWASTWRADKPCQCAPAAYGGE